MSSAIYLGVKGSVVALDRATGQQLWITKLKRSDFVNVVLDQGLIVATASGEVFALDPETGAIRWHNNLPGLGYGLVTVATPGANSIAPFRSKQEHDEAAAAAATT